MREYDTRKQDRRSVGLSGIGEPDKDNEGTSGNRNVGGQNEG